MGVTAFTLRGDLIIEVAMFTGKGLCPLITLWILIILNVIEKLLLIAIPIYKSLPGLLEYLLSLCINDLLVID